MEASRACKRNSANRDSSGVWVAAGGGTPEVLDSSPTDTRSKNRTGFAPPTAPTRLPPPPILDKAGATLPAHAFLGRGTRPTVRVNAVLPGTIETEMGKDYFADPTSWRRVQAIHPLGLGVRKTSPMRWNSCLRTRHVGLPGRNSSWTAAFASKTPSLKKIVH